jgi:hypothetical protein
MCPVCSAYSGIGGDTLPLEGAPEYERTMRDRKEPPAPEPQPAEPKLSPEEERAAWYAAAGLPFPDQAGPVRDFPVDEPLPALTDARDYGTITAAIVLLAQAVASLVVMIVSRSAGVWAIAGVVFEVAAALGVLREIGPARFLMLAAVLVHLLQSAAGLVLTGSWVFAFSALPSLLAVAAFYLTSVHLRVLLCVVGAGAAFGSIGLSARGPVTVADSRLRFEVKGGAFADASEGWAFKAPEGVALYDRKRMNEALEEARSGVLGAVLGRQVPGAAGAERLEIQSADGSASGGLLAMQLPPRLRLASVVPSLSLLAPGAVRDDGLVPLRLRESPVVESEGWRSYSSSGVRSLVVVLADDGRMVAIHCTPALAQGERHCADVFAGLSFVP